VRLHRARKRMTDRLAEPAKQDPGPSPQPQEAAP
jgi:hypothetical protein